MPQLMLPRPLESFGVEAGNSSYAKTVIGPISLTARADPHLQKYLHTVLYIHVQIRQQCDLTLPALPQFVVGNLIYSPTNARKTG
jgi:hypothetical protein